MNRILSLIILTSLHVSMQAQIYEPHVFTPKTVLPSKDIYQHEATADVTVQRMLYSTYKYYTLNPSTGEYGLVRIVDTQSYKFSGDRFTSPTINQFDSNYCIVNDPGYSSYSRIRTYNSLNKLVMDKKFFEDDAAIKDERHLTYYDDNITIKTDSSSINELPYPNYCRVKTDYNENGQVTSYIVDKSIYTSYEDNHIDTHTFTYDELNRLSLFYQNKINTLGDDFTAFRYYYYDGDSPYPYKDSLCRVTKDHSSGLPIDTMTIINTFTFDANGYPETYENVRDGVIREREMYNYSEDGLLLSQIKYIYQAGMWVPNTNTVYTYNPSHLLTTQMTYLYLPEGGYWINYIKKVNEYSDDILSVSMEYHNIRSFGVIPPSYIVAEDSMALHHKINYHRNSFGNLDSIIREVMPFYDYSSDPVVIIFRDKYVEYFNYGEVVVDMPDVDVSSAYMAFPNPVSDVLIIQNPLLEDLKIKIIDINGQTRKMQKNSRRVEQVKVEVSELDKGWYILEVIGDNGTPSRQKILIQ